MCTLLALGLVGTGIQVAGMMAQGQQAEVMAEYQARVYEQQALADQQQAAFDMRQERRQQELRQAAARAATGASGVGLSGSPAAVLTANAREGQLDIQAIRYGSQLRQGQLRTQAGISRFQGRQARQASYIGAAGAAIGGFTNAYTRSVQMAQNSFA